jgi:hypothetical protein
MFHRKVLPSPDASTVPSGLNATAEACPVAEPGSMSVVTSCSSATFHR